MRILIVHNAYINRGGEETCVLNESQALRSVGIEVITHEVSNIHSISAKIDAMLAPFGGAEEKTLESALDEYKPNILHVHNLFPLLSPRVFRAAKQRGIKTVLTLHNFRPLCLNGLFLTPSLEVCERCSAGNYWPGILRGCYRRSRVQSTWMAAHLGWARRQQWYADVDAFIAPSQFLKNKYVEAGFPSKRFAVQSHFLLEPPTATPQTPSPYVLYLGRISEEKGIRQLIQLFRNQRLPLKLVIAGNGPIQSDVLKASGVHIQYVGFIKGKQKETYLSQALALVMPSNCYENFPLAILEANAYGTPALVSRQGGLEEMISSGINGLTYAIGNEEEFWAMLYTIRDLWGNIERRAECQKYVRTRFSKSHFLEQRLALYQKLSNSSSAAELVLV